MLLSRDQYSRRHVRGTGKGPGALGIPFCAIFARPIFDLNLCRGRARPARLRSAFLSAEDYDALSFSPLVSSRGRLAFIIPSSVVSAGCKLTAEPARLSLPSTLAILTAPGVRWKTRLASGGTVSVKLALERVPTSGLRFATMYTPASSCSAASSH